MDSFEHLAKAKYNLLKICEFNNSSKPFYNLIEKSNRNYEMAVESDGRVFRGRALSKRLAKKLAAIEAVNELKFKKCTSNAITQLVQFCQHHHLIAPVFKELISKDNTFCCGSEIIIEIDEKPIHLIGRGYGYSAKQAKLCSARDVLDQIETIYQS